LLEKLNGFIIYLYTFNVKTTLLDKVSEEAIKFVVLIIVHDESDGLKLFG
jgi:hypothetical protein